MQSNLSQIPSHVPPELVRPFSLTPRTTSYVDPFAELVPKIHEGPAVFWGTDIFPGPAGGGWVIRRNEDLKAVYDNTSEVMKRGNTQFAAMIGESWDIIPTELDPPTHTAFRTALNPLYTPKKIAELEQKVRERSQSLIARIKDRDGCDFIKDYAIPLPVSIFLDLMGLPQDRMQEFLDWENALIHAPTWEVRGRAVKLAKDMLYQAVDARIADPGDDLISQVLKLRVNGRPWSREEVFGHCFNLFLGGLDTVTANLGLHFYHLARHPELQRELREDPSKIENALQELLRAYAAVTTMRLCKQDFTLHGLTIKAGDRIAMSTPLGSNDPEVFPNPQTIDIQRRPVHLTFGFGLHRCLGAHLARRELDVSLREMLLAIPEFRLEDGFKTPFLLSNVIHVNELQLVWNR
jgi:cytochrome P450